MLVEDPGRRRLVIHVGMLWSKLRVLKGIIAGARCNPSIHTAHQNRAQHVTLRYGAGTATRARWALGSARAYKAAMRHAAIGCLKPLRALLSGPPYAPQPLIIGGQPC
eukprot:6142433-Pyramimonas_sp.AAC.1